MPVWALWAGGVAVVGLFTKSAGDEFGEKLASYVPVMIGGFIVWQVVKKRVL